MLPHEDKSLPQIARNILAVHHYEGKRKSTFEDGQSQERLHLELRLADEFERTCPFWGMAIPYNGNGGGITPVVKPRVMRYGASYTLELSQDMSAMYGKADVQRELVRIMTAEMVAEIDQLIDGRDLKYYPCVTARPIVSIDPNSFQPFFRFDTIFYLARPMDTFWSFEGAPEVPVTTPSRRFMERYHEHINDPCWPSVSRF